METSVQTCYRHPDRQAGVVCQRCDRPICPSCMHQASVGFHCPECAKKGNQKVYQGFGSWQAPPLVTQVLIGLNVAVFVLGVALTGGEALLGGTDFHRSLAVIAKLWELDGTYYIADIPGSSALGVGNGQWYRLITAGFIQYGFIHLGVNMYSLWVLGPLVEQSVGRLRFGLVYLAGLLGGSFGALLVSPDTFTGGASGAIFGLLGAMFLAFRAAGVPFSRSPLLPVLVINLLITIGVPGISVGGHVGGLIGGAIAGWITFDLARRPEVDKRMVTGALVGLCVALAAGAIAFATGYQPL